MKGSIDKGGHSHLPPNQQDSGSEECSSSESGWTTYIASPDLLEHEYADRNNEDDDDDDNDVNIARKGFKKVEQEEAAADSDDSMASDASSGPSDQYGYIGRSHGGLSHVGSNNQRKAAAKKQEEKKKQIKGEKDKSGNSAGRLKKF
ncbi:protein SOB FIVE-LIKE 4-like [Salvia splendens]|uniref:protein SOB FIVE-LIKE 4-like n=1 Tax=Salvia splendens TaxID=180675 RepID=UPI001C277020|nr:protein SOB FIVE-LIKE 4-like [Salvia splendens]